MKARTRGERQRQRVAGRKRNPTTDRKPSGEIRDRSQDRGPLVPPEVTAHRAVYNTASHGDQRAGSAAGKLLALGMITAEQHEAALKLSELWQAWSCMACKPRFPIDGRPVICDAEDPDKVVAQRWQRLKRRLADVRASVLCVEAGALSWSLVETICADDLVPPALDPASTLFRPWWVIGVKAMRDGLDSVFMVLCGGARKAA